MVQSIFTILLAICAGIYHEWKLGLVSSLFVPFVLVGSVFQAKIMSSQDNVEREAFAKSAKVWFWLRLDEYPDVEEYLNFLLVCGDGNNNASNIC